MNTDQQTGLATVPIIVAKGCFAGIALAKLGEPGPDVLLGGYLALAFSCSTVSVNLLVSSISMTVIVGTNLTNKPASFVRMLVS